MMTPLGKGSTFGAYRVSTLLGRGERGDVYHARHVTSGKEVALKVLSATDPDMREAFRREATILESVSDANVLAVHGLGEHEGTLFYAMQLLTTKSLEDVLKSPVTLPRAVAIGQDILRGLYGVHKKGITHGQISTKSIKFEPLDGLVLAGFGRPGTLGATVSSDLKQVALVLEQLFKACYPQDLPEALSEFFTRARGESFPAARDMLAALLRATSEEPAPAKASVPARAAPPPAQLSRIFYVQNRADGNAIVAGLRPAEPRRSAPVKPPTKRPTMPSNVLIGASLCIVPVIVVRTIVMAEAPKVFDLVQRVGSTTAIINYTTNVDCRTDVQFWPSSSSAKPEAVAVEPRAGRSHRHVITGLAPNRAYNFRLRFFDALNNLTPSHLSAAGEFLTGSPIEVTRTQIEWSTGHIVLRCDTNVSARVAVRLHVPGGTDVTVIDQDGLDSWIHRVRLPTLARNTQHSYEVMVYEFGTTALSATSPTAYFTTPGDFSSLENPSGNERRADRYTDPYNPYSPLYNPYGRYGGFPAGPYTGGFR